MLHHVMHTRAMNASGVLDVWQSLFRCRRFSRMAGHFVIQESNFCHKNFARLSSADLRGFKVIPLLHSSFDSRGILLLLKKRKLQARMMVTRHSHNHFYQVKPNQLILLPFCSFLYNFANRMGPQNSQHGRSCSTQRLLIPHSVMPDGAKVRKE